MQIQLGLDGRSQNDIELIRAIVRDKIVNDARNYIIQKQVDTLFEIICPNFNKTDISIINTIKNMIEQNLKKIYDADENKVEVDVSNIKLDWDKRIVFYNAMIQRDAELFKKVIATQAWKTWYLDESE